MAAEVPAPNYPTPNYDQFGAILGNLANAYRSGETQNLDLDARKAFMDGFPTNAQGQPDWAKALQVYAQKGGDIRNTYNLAELAATQGQQQQLQQTMSSILGVGTGGGASRPTGDIPPASASRAQPSLPSGAGGGYAEPMASGVQAPKGAGFNDAIQDLQQDAEDQGISTEMISGQRDSAKQAKLRANMEAGRAGKPLPYPELGAVAVAAEPGSSPHEQGIAADVVAGGGQQQRLIEMAREPWRNLKPGADFGDPNHFEAAGGARPAQVAQAGGAQPLVPMPPLVEGTSTPQESIAKIDELMLKVASNPNTPPTFIKAMEARRQAFVDAITPMKLGPYERFVDPQHPKTVVAEGAMAGQGAGLDPQALDSAADVWINSGKFPQNIGKGFQGQQVAKAIMDRAFQIHPELAGADLSTRWQDFAAEGAGKNAGARTQGTREKNLDIILKVTSAAIPAALEQSEKVARTGWVPVNKIIQAGQIATSDPELKAFGMANLQLAEGWARAMNPTGVMRESDREKALEFLSTADSPQTYKRAVMQLKTQIDRELEGVRSERAGKADDAPAQAAPPSGLPDGWTVKVLP